MYARGLCKQCGKNPHRSTSTICDPCHQRVLEYVKTPEQRAKRNAREKRYLKEYRQKVIEGYGGKCACCGEVEYDFLTLDHVHRDGAKEKRHNSHRCGGRSFWKSIIDEGFPSRYQILCFNCNCGRERNNGICPHRR